VADGRLRGRRDGAEVETIYLSGASNRWLRANASDPKVGLLLQPRVRSHGDLPLFHTWAADNDCFSRGPDFDLGFFLAWLEARSAFAATAVFATAPDILGDARATWRRSEPVLATIRGLGFPAALVAQDGFSFDEVDTLAFDVLFLGGTTAWKVSERAVRIGLEARDRGIGVHMGRVNSRRRVAIAAAAGAETVDGTFLARAPDTNWPRMKVWLDNPSLWESLDR